MNRSLPATLLLLILASACVILALPGSSYARQDREATMAGPSSRHWTGTDSLGRDRTVRMSAALLLGLSGATLASAAATLLAAVVGMLAAFTRPFVGWTILLASDVFLALPWIFLLMIVRAGLPLTLSPAHSAAITFLLLAALGWPACAQAVYRGAVALQRSEWRIQAHASGLRDSQVMRRHLLPNLRPLLLTQFLLCIPAFLVAEANLGTLGLGITEPLPSWGAMLSELGGAALLMPSLWVYLPIALLIIVLLLLESFTAEV